MKNGLCGLITVALLSCSGMTLAADEEMKKEQPATETAQPEKMAAQKDKKDKASALRLKAGEPRPKDLDLRHCLEQEDNAAIAKCAGE